MLERIFPLVPNIAFHRAVKEYAFFRGKPVFTQRDLDAALVNYVFIAQKLN